MQCLWLLRFLPKTTTISGDCINLYKRSSLVCIFGIILVLSLLSLVIFNCDLWRNSVEIDAMKAFAFYGGLLLILITYFLMLHAKYTMKITKNTKQVNIMFIFRYFKASFYSTLLPKMYTSCLSSFLFEVF